MTEPTMTAAQALAIVDEATGRLQVNRADTFAIWNALQVLAALVEPVETE